VDATDREALEGHGQSTDRNVEIDRVESVSQSRVAKGNFTLQAAVIPFDTLSTLDIVIF
jgi:hypothetical protein